MNIVDLQAEAESGNVVAQSILGVCYLEGIDVGVDYKEAFRLLSSAALQGVPRAIANLGQMYAEGLGVALDLAEAARLYEKAAQEGEFLAQIEIARAYLYGSGVAADQKVALRWYSVAAEQNGSVIDCPELQEAKAYVELNVGKKGKF